MRTRFPRRAALAVLALALGACGGPTAPVVFSDPAAAIRVEPGGLFDVVLESNATTGYSWRLTRPLEATYLQLVESRYEAPDSGLVGAGGRERWRFRALAPGRTQIALEYVRSWEVGQLPARAATFEVEIRR